MAAIGCGDDEGTTSTGEASTDAVTTGEVDTAAATDTSAADDTSGSSTGEPPFEPPACDSEDYDWVSLIPGPAESAWDSDLAAVALRHDRLSAAFVGWPIGLDADVAIPIDDADGRAALDAFLDGEGWDFEAQSGLAVGRATLNGYLNEHNIEGNYGGFANGFHALMAIGIVGALAYVAEDPDVDSYLHDELIAQRKLPGLAASSLLVDFGAGTNFSNYNMAFAAAWMALRYLDDAEAQADIHDAVAFIYDNGSDRQPAEQGQALFDLVWAATELGGTAFDPPSGTPSDEVIASALSSLGDFPVPPAYDITVDNCDVDEIAADVCTLNDGTMVDLLGAVGHNGELVSAVPTPIGIRPPSNYEWRSNPYRVNGGGDGSNLPGSADFRFAYWIGRWTRR